MSDEGTYSEFHLPTSSKPEIEPHCDCKIYSYTLQNVNYNSQSNMTILIICVYALKRNKHAESWILSTFQSWDIGEDPWPQKHKLSMHFTKLPKRDNIYKLCLYMLEEHNCLLLTLQHVPKLRYRAYAQKYNLSYIALNHSSVTILKHFVFFLFIDCR